MFATIEIGNEKWRIDLDKGFDLSIPLARSSARAWYVDPISITPVINTRFVGSVRLGGKVNFRDVKFNPHGHGTHTECVGHISKENFDVNLILRNYWFSALVISITPSIVQQDEGTKKTGDRIIVRSQIEEAIRGEKFDALIVRTLPNNEEKKSRNYSGTNFCYFDHEAMELLVSLGIEHLLVDLPSIDREEDAGQLLAHHAFWQYPHNTRVGATITEFLFVPDVVKDGKYLLNLQMAALSNDASPSRPLLYLPIQ